MSSFLAAIRHPVARFGVALTTASAVVFLVALVVDLTGGMPNPYAGIVIFLALPGLFVAGLALIAAGAWLGRGRAPKRPSWPRVDLNEPQQRRLVVFLGVATLANVVILSFATGGGVAYMETDGFCGQVCHEPMGPHLVSHQAGPHAEVSCAACHIGPGARSFVEAKVRGVNQLLGVVTGDYPRPIHPPLGDRRPVTEVCTQCHTTDVRPDRLRVTEVYGDDAANTASSSGLWMRIGGVDPVRGRAYGIHWHADPEVEVTYVTFDDHAEAIPYVEVTDRDGSVTAYRAEGTEGLRLEDGVPMRMDCRDCHTRTAHAFGISPEREVDRALALGRVDPSLPFVRREMVAALTPDYPSAAAAEAAIGEALRGFYADAFPDAGIEMQREVGPAIDVARWLHATNVAPDMNVQWGTYRSQIGHTDVEGCFRCHDGGHEAADGSIIRQDCELCHRFE